MKARMDFTDIEAMVFLKALNAAGFEVTDWEAKFIETALKRDNFRRESTPPITFSEGQRNSIWKMMCSYAHRLASPSSSLHPPSSSRLPAATAGRCGFMVKSEDGHAMKCCGSPAVTRVLTYSRDEMELCAEHLREREKLMAKFQERKRGERI